MDGTCTGEAAGVPDWRDAAAYPSPDELTLEQWRWEFLRRNHDYRRDYFRDSDSFGAESRARYFERVYHILHPFDPMQSVRSILSDSADGSIFGPSFEAVFVESRLQHWYCDMYELKSRVLSDAEPHHLFIRVDLKRPLEPQFHALKQIAKNAQRSWNGGKINVRRAHKRNWPLYLRVLDARDAGASYATIARELLKNRNSTEQAARDIVKQAEALRDYWRYNSH
jgi:Family of unknown function (DUF6499)